MKIFCLYNCLRNIVLFIAVLPFLVSCSSDSKLNESLALSSSNRVELEKILNHYARPADKLKYKAALFLIENMRDCCYKDFAYHKKYIQIVDSICQIENFAIDNFMSDIDSISKCLNKKMAFGGFRMKRDLEHITAHQLIRHIDLCFESLKYPWCSDLKFSDFCEYVLPYRIGNEKNEDWMEIYRNSMRTFIDSFVNVNMSSTSIGKYLLQKSMKKDFFYTTIIPDLSPSSLLYSKIGLGNCKELQATTAYSLRGIGIPIAIDLTPQWAKRNGGHGWCVLVGKHDQFPFLFHDQVPFGKHVSSIQQKDGLAKVYRRTFSEQNESLANLTPQEEIPPFFEDRHLKDVSELYFKPTEIAIELSIAPPIYRKYAYLSVFDNQEWVAVAWSSIINGKVQFKKIGRGNVYLVTYFHKGKSHPASNPFIVEENEMIKYLNPDKTSFTAISLKRKYPDKENVYELAKRRTVGGKFQIVTGVVSNFTDLCTIDKFPETLAPTSIVLDTSIEAKAFRYVSAPNSNVYLAELEVYDEQDEMIEGNIIGTDGSWYNNGRDKYKVFDHNMLTFFDAPEISDGWVGLEFKQKQKIKRIVYAPYNDDNGINKGELYELFYFDKGWVSLGEKYGDNSYCMKYDKVPRNALLLLKNKMKGKEVRIFTQEDGNHRWW